MGSTFARLASGDGPRPGRARGVLLVASPAHADPRPGEQWAVAPHTVLDLPGAWALSQGAGVIVAVVDSGTRLSHPDLAPNLWTNPAEIPGNHRDDDGNGYVDDIHGVNLSGAGATTTCATRSATARTSRARSPPPPTAAA